MHPPGFSMLLGRGDYENERSPMGGQTMTDHVPRRGSYVAPSPELSRAERRRQRRRKRRMEGYYRPEHPVVTWLKRIGLTLFITAGTALMIYALFFYKP
ncbi:hypothetical protein [Microbacterium sp.]|uniref:hypothetical protein n=1 Tax=Microbacterium sp. TaxID=51671 RepID=UPI003A90F3BB